MRVVMRVEEFVTKRATLGDIEVAVEVPGIVDLTTVHEVVTRALSTLVDQAERDSERWLKDRIESDSMSLVERVTKGTPPSPEDAGVEPNTQVMPDDTATSLTEHYLTAPKTGAGIPNDWMKSKPFEPYPVLVSDAGDENIQVRIAWRHGASHKAPNPGNMSAESYGVLLSNHAREFGLVPKHWMEGVGGYASRFRLLAEKTIETFGEALKRSEKRG